MRSFLPSGEMILMPQAPYQLAWRFSAAFLQMTSICQPRLSSSLSPSSLTTFGAEFVIGVDTDRTPWGISLRTAARLQARYNFTILCTSSNIAHTVTFDGNPRDTGLKKICKKNTGAQHPACRPTTFPLVAILLWMAVFCDAALALDGCTPPVPPAVPQDAALLREYADLIEQDFQAYFDALTDFSICHDQLFFRTMEEARGVSANYRSFLDRAAAAGAALVPRHETGPQLDIQRPEIDRRGSR